MLTGGNFLLYFFLFSRNLPILCTEMPKGGRPSVHVWAAVGTPCQRLCSSPMKFARSLLKSALLLDPVTNESNLGWMPLTWPWPVETIGQTQPLEKMFCTNEPSGGHRSVKKEDNVQSFQVHIYNERSTQPLSGWRTRNKESICTLIKANGPWGCNRNMFLI